MQFNPCLACLEGTAPMRNYYLKKKMLPLCLTPDLVHPWWCHYHHCMSHKEPMTCSAKLSAPKDGSWKCTPCILAYLTKCNMEYGCLIYMNHVQDFLAANMVRSLWNASQRYLKWLLTHGDFHRISDFCLRI